MAGSSRGYIWWRQPFPPIARSRCSSSPTARRSLASKSWSGQAYPVGDFRLRLKRRHGPPEEIKPGTVLHLRLHGIERFIAQAKHVQDGRGTRREFALGEEDRAFLDSLGLAWETLKVPNPVPGQPPRLWVVIYDLPVPDGFNVSKAHVAIEIAPGYPTAS